MKTEEGDIFWASFSPTIGQEQQGLRPCVVVSGNSLNRLAGLSMVCPLTTTLRNYKWHVLLFPNKENGLKNDSLVLVHQIRTVDHRRLGKKIGCVSKAELETIRKGVVTFLYH